MSKNILWFEEINKDQIPEVGGKGANLGEMYNNNFPIPNGFVVTSFAYAKNAIENSILKTIENIEKNINVNDINELNTKSKQIKELILSKPISKNLEEEILNAYKKLGKCLIAVRSSATAEDLPSASFAGQQDTYLNIFGESELLLNVKKCWASLFNPRAIFYRRKQNFPIEKVKLAVVVQKQVESFVSGIMFSANPITNNLNEIVIEAVYGLGETIVSGSITPDTYIVNKKTWQITSKTIAKQTWQLIKDKTGNKKENVPKKLQDKQKISDEIILKYAKIGQAIEEHYKKPQDLEWAIEKDILYIVQSRPITTLNLKNNLKSQEEEIKQKSILRGLGASVGFATGPVRIIKSLKELNKIKDKDIMVTKMTTPDMVPQMKKAAAIITDEGGITCHAAIVSRELGIPAIVGTEVATKILKEDQLVSVDATKGKVYDGIIDNKITLEKKELKKAQTTSFITSTKVKVNLAFSDAAEKASLTNPDGIGLMRAEHILTISKEHPYHMIHTNKSKELQTILESELEKILKYFKDLPVYYRTFDARTDEYINLKGGKEEPKEDNPMLGWHGIRRDLDEPEMLKVQFRAIKNMILKGYKNIGIMIPFTQNVQEYIEAKKIAKEVGLNPHKDCFFGIMVETPGCSLTIEEYIKEKIDFVSFGTNDLTQLTLGLDRNNEKIQKWFTEFHPAILKQIAHVINACRQKGIRTSICGQAGSNPEMVKILVGLGIESISANIDAVDKIRETVYIAERELILDSIRNRNLKDKSF